MERYTTEVALADRIDEVENQGIIGKPFELLNDTRSKDLLGGHALSTGMFEDAPFGKALKAPIVIARVGVEEPTNAFQELCMWMVHICRVKGHLFLIFLAHFIRISSNIRFDRDLAGDTCRSYPLVLQEDALHQSWNGKSVMHEYSAQKHCR